MSFNRGSCTRRACLALALPLPGLAGAVGLAVAPASQRAALPTRPALGVVLLSAATAGQRLVAVGERGLVLVSDDNGGRWQQQPTPVSVTLTTVRFADAKHGVAIGHGGIVLMTDDAGARWRVVFDGQRAAQVALASARASGDAGLAANAERLVADGPDKPFLDVLMPDAATLLVVGAYGLAFASNDGGRSWSSWIERFDNPKALHLYAVRQRGDTCLVAGEQGLLLHSTSNGQRFRRLTSPYRGSFFVAELLSEQDIVVAGLRGNVWRSADAGNSWSQVATPMPASITAALRAPDGTLWLANQAGFVMRLSGDRLAVVNKNALPPINGLVIGAGRQLTALTMNGALPVPAASTVG